MACGASPARTRGLPTRLAKDCELFDTWSSATNLSLWDLVEDPFAVVEEDPVRNLEYEVPPAAMDGAKFCFPLVARPGRTGVLGMEVVEMLRALC